MLGGVVAACCLLVGLTITVLKTNWGGERLRRFAVTRANAQIQGRLDIGRLSFGGTRVVVEDVQLRDPDGHFVGSVARAEVNLAPLRVLHKELRVTGVSITTPVLDMASTPTGSNLSRALSPRHATPPKPAQPKTSKEGWLVKLDRFELTGGAVTMATGGEPPAATKLNVKDLALYASARYATGNGNLDLNVRLEGQSVQAPTGPLQLTADTHVRGQVVQLSADGVLLGGTLLARANVDGRNLAAAQAQVGIDIPAMALAGSTWGPLRVKADATPGTVPQLALSLDIPGVTLRGTGGGSGSAKDSVSGRFDFKARLAAADLELTAKAVHALAGGALLPISGHGAVDLTVGGPMAGAPASFGGEVTVDVPRVAQADMTVTGLTMTARAQHLSRDPGQATLALAVAAVHAGKTVLRGIDVSGAWQGHDIKVGAKLSAPEPSQLALAARMDDDWQGLTLTRLDLSYPGTEWAMDSAALVGFRDDNLSLESFSLSSRGQTLTIDGRKTGQSVSGHVALEHLRLDALPALLVDPTLRLGGELGIEVKASGTTSAPRVVAAVRWEHGRVHGFSKIGAKVDATLADRHVDGTLDVESPLAALRARFGLPTNVADDPHAPLEFRLDVSRLDLGDVLRVTAPTAHADGHLTASLRASGSLASPEVEATVTGKELQVTPSLTAVKDPQAIDLGHVRLRVSYAHEQAKADLDFASSHGGTLRVDAATHVDLSYPRVTEGLVVPKLPVRGKVAAKNLDVAWLAQLSDRVQAMAGQVDADAKLTGTVGDPQFVGDVRWKNGKVIANAATEAPAGAPAAARRPRRSGH